MVEEIINVMKKYNVQAVGNGYIDLICPVENVSLFIAEISRIGIKIKGFTWWCYVSDDHEPCGMGGPRNRYGSGWFSEIPMSDIISFENNDEYIDFLVNRWPKCKEYRKCYWPAFWLE